MTTSARLASACADLIVGGSLEIGPSHAGQAPAIAELLPTGTRVYVNHLPRHGLAQSLAAVAALRAAGLEPVPHVSARRVESAAELEAFLERAVGDSGVRKVLIIGGDEPKPLGPYQDAAALLHEPVLARAGLREVAFAGHPEGHPRISAATLEQAIDDKLALARSLGLEPSIVTQFSFAPTRVVDYCSALGRRFPDVPVYVGMAGPTEPAALLRFAQRCGVSASLRALGAQGMGAVRLFMHTDPREQLEAVAQYGLRQGGGSVVGAHIFSFAAPLRAAQWMRGVVIARPEG